MQTFEERSSMLVKVLKLCNVTLEDHNEDVERIRDWIRTQPHLPEVPSYELISNTLIKSKFSLEKTKQTLDYYYTIRSLMPEAFDRSDEMIERILNVTMEKTEFFFPMPKLTPEGYRVNFAKNYGDPKEIETLDIINHRAAIFEIRYLKDCVVGDIHVEDLSDMQLGHVTIFTPMFIKKCVTLYETVYNNRIKAIHLLNAPGYFQTVLNLAKRFMKAKLASRMYAHKNVDSLKEVLPLECLPEEYGGTGPKISALIDLWKKELESFKPIFAELDKLRSEENKRPTPLINDDVLGYYGSFKKINLD